MKRLIFWDFPRTTWQYDVVVGLILAFIFLTPRTFFKDQPRAVSVVRVPVHESGEAFWVDAGLIDPSLPAPLADQAGTIISRKTGYAVEVLRVERITNPEDETRGYMAFIRRK